MFNKILIANRGMIAARIVRTCREMGVATVAVYSPSDQSSLHVRLADECIPLASSADLYDGAGMVALAQACGADAIHPGYGFLAEEADFIRRCHKEGIQFIGPPAEVVESLRNKIDAQEAAAAAGFLTPAHTLSSFGPKDLSQIEARAAELGYPLIIKSCSGGRGRGERLALRPQALAEAVRQAQAVSQAVYGNSQIYMEKAILPACQVGVQIVADGHGNLIHLGEREGSVLLRGMKIVEETPARCLSTQQRAELWQTAVDLARLFNYQGVGTVEFLVDPVGKAYFTEIKARIQVEHALTEMLARIDLVREQIHIAAGEALSLVQEEVSLNGWAMMARVRANDPWQDNMPSPGPLQRLRLPGGPEVRVDTYVYCQAEVPAEYDPLLANLTVWGATREQSLARLQRALEEFIIMGTASNLPVLQLIATHPRFVDGSYSTGLQIGLQKHPTMPYPDEHLRDLAAAAAILFLRRYQKFDPQPPPRFAGGWHKSSRRLPQ